MPGPVGVAGLVEKFCKVVGCAGGVGGPLRQGNGFALQERKDED